MLVFTSLVATLYFVLILLFMKGWKTIPTFHFHEYTEDIPAITVVVACQNEEKNLPGLLQSLKNQSISAFQLILIDDNSSDNTWQIMQEAMPEFGNIKILKSNDTGKKKALKTGIEQADNEFIVTTDADCTPTPHWLESIAKYQKKLNPDLIIGPVAISPANSFFDKLQETEFLSLISSGAGAAGLNNPIMCNGANLAFRKEMWLSNYAKIREELNSGDDVFLMHALKREKHKISFIKSTDSIVNTNPCSSLSEFYKQRKRWASKAPHYTDLMTIFVASTVLLIALLQVVLLVLGVLNISFFYGYVLLTTSKLIVDTLFLKQTASFFGQKTTAKTVIPLAVIYPFYILATSLSGIFTSLKNHR